MAVKASAPAPVPGIGGIGPGQSQAKGETRPLRGEGGVNYKNLRCLMSKGLCPAKAESAQALEASFRQRLPSQKNIDDGCAVTALQRQETLALAARETAATCAPGHAPGM